jgi:hypothetical protein
VFTDSNESTKTDLPGGRNSNRARKVLHALSRYAISTNPPALTISTTRRLGIAHHIPIARATISSPYPTFQTCIGKLRSSISGPCSRSMNYVMAADARLAVIVVVIVLGWPSTRGLTVPEIAAQIGCPPLTSPGLAIDFAKCLGSSSTCASSGPEPSRMATSRRRFKHRQDSQEPVLIAR